MTDKTTGLDPNVIDPRTRTIEALTLELDHYRAALAKLADSDFDWSTDCGNQLPYDEWVSHVASIALEGAKK